MPRRPAQGPGAGPLRVLVVNQTATTSGAEHSLLTLLAALNPADVIAIVASPVGDLSEAVARLGLEHVPIRGTDASFRLSLRTTPVELLSMLRSAFGVARAARRLGVDVVHANTTRAGLIAIAARLFGAPRPLVHVRDWAPPGRASTLVTRLVARGSRAIVANSRHIARSFDGERARGPVHVVHNPVDLVRFDPAAQDPAEARRALGLSVDEPVAGIVGQLTPWKGQDDAVRALAVARASVPGARLVVAGSAKFTTTAGRHDNAAYAADLEALPAQLGLDDAVIFLGEVADVPQVLAALDVLLVPSWEEAFGRVVVEGMAMGLPVIATSVGGPPELVDDGLTGTLLTPRQPDAWGARLAVLLAPWAAEERRALGAAAHEASRRFSPAAHAAAIGAIYRDVAADRFGRPATKV